MAAAIQPRQDQLNWLYFEIFGPEEERPQAKPSPSNLPDEVLIKKAMTAANGQKFKALWEGSTEGYTDEDGNPDESSADMALMSILAYWTGGDKVQMERLFFRSGLGLRDKWIDRADYRKRTIKKAISRCKEFYKGSKDESKSEITEEELKAIKIPENPRFKTNLEYDNYFRVFMGYGETVTDSYPDYWFACGLFCISVVVNKKAVVKLRQGPIYSNVWINILGLSSLARKSTAVDKADIAITTANIDPKYKMPDEFSPEAMVEKLDNTPHAYMIKDEAAGLLALMKKDYMRGLKDALMQLYDCKPISRMLRTSKRTSDKTSFNVADPYLCMILATTPGSFAANTELIDLTSGWLPRFLHFFPNHAKDRWLPLEEGVPENDLLSANCHARLLKIKEEFYDLPEARTMHLSKDAAVYFTEWQKLREKELVAAKDDRKAQFYSRLAVYVLKMGMLFTIGRADYKEGMEISLDHTKEACRLVDEYFMPMATTVADLVGKAADKNLMDKIIAVLTSRGGKLTRRELMKAIHQKRKDLTDALESLEESGEVRVATVSNRRGPSTEWIMLVADNDKSHNVPTVPTVYSSILSHQESKPDKRGNEGKCDSMDSMTVGTVWDKIPTDSDLGDGTNKDTPDTVPSSSVDKPSKQKKRASNQTEEFKRFKGLLGMNKGKGWFEAEEFLKRCDQSNVTRAQAKKWIQAFTEDGKIRSNGAGMLEVIT